MAERVATASIRPGRPEDATALRAVEVDAGARFRDVDMPDIADAEPMGAEELVAYAEAGRCWVVVDAADCPFAFVVVDLVDGVAHVEEVCVSLQRQGEGWGRALVDEVDAWAGSVGLRSLTLTTFRDVPWNRPLYEHLGFRSLDDGELTRGLERKRAHEATLGLDPGLRVCMARDVSPRPAG